MSNVARSSGFLTADTLVHTGRCKLVSIHGCNIGANASGTPAYNPITLNLYDNVAASGKIVAKVQLSPTPDGAGGFYGTSVEFDMHGVICENGLYADIVINSATAGGGAGQNAATSGFTIEFA